ncbi:MAG: hypothetical protein ABJ239_10320 [Erythrobacter sp.]
MHRFSRHTALIAALFAVLATLSAAPASAKDSLGVYDNWAVFRDASVPRCYTIAKAEPSRRASEQTLDYEPYLTVATWPGRNIRNQLHIRLSRKLAANPRLRLVIGSRGFNLTAGGGDGWARDKAMDAAIIAVMRSATLLSVTGTDTNGKRFTDRYSLDGVATAIDAATLGCAAQNLK